MYRVILCRCDMLWDVCACVPFACLGGNLMRDCCGLSGYEAGIGGRPYLLSFLSSSSIRGCSLSKSKLSLPLLDSCMYCNCTAMSSMVSIR